MPTLQELQALARERGKILCYDTTATGEIDWYRFETDPNASHAITPAPGKGGTPEGNFPRSTHQSPTPTRDPYLAVPAELKARKQWVLWREETRNGKPTKIPYQVSGQNAKSTDPRTWTDYQTAIKHSSRSDGIGFVFSPDDKFYGIDLDNCLDDGGKVKSWAQQIVERLKTVSYGEVSPSGRGIKFWTNATFHATEAKHKVYINARAGEAIEAYDRGRYFTVTGKGKGNISDGQEVVDWIVAEYLSKQQEQTPLRRSHPTPTPSSHLTAEQVIAKIQESRQSAKFNALMRGNTTGYGSQSEADLALCSVIGFWTQDARVIDAIFRQSVLMRAKWDEQHRASGETYGEMTISEALTSKTENYQPPKRPALTWGLRNRRKRRWI